MYENCILTVWLIVSSLCMGHVLSKYYLLCTEELLNCIFIHPFIHSLQCVSFSNSVASPKVNPPQIVMWFFLFQVPETS